MQDQDCISCNETVNILLGLLPSENKEKYNQQLKADFKKFIVTYKQELMIAAFESMDADITKLNQQPLEEEYKKCKSYLMCCLYPSLYLNTLEKRQVLWKFIQDELKYQAEQLRKACLPADKSGNHTEQMLVRLFNAHPQYLLGNLKKQFEDKKAQKLADFPKHLGLIVDSFSWLDVCKTCIVLLHKNGGIWDAALEDLKPLIVAEGFTVPFPKIDGLFRFVAEHRYPDTSTYYSGKVPPLDLTDAEGGPDYTKSGWDFRVLSEERILLATRYNQRETLCRDRVVEGIQNRLVEAVFTRDSLEFFVQKWLWPILAMKRPFCINALRMLQAFHPENMPLRIKLAQQLEEDDPHRYNFLKGILGLAIPNEVMKKEKYFNDILPKNIKDHPQEYTRAYFGKSCVAKIKNALESNVGTSSAIQDIPSCIIDFANFSQPAAEIKIETFEEATKSIDGHWSTKWNKGKRNLITYPRITMNR